MHAHFELNKLQRAGLVRALRIRAQVADTVIKPHPGCNGSSDSSMDRAIAFAVIELDNLWASVARSLYLSAAFCGVDESGARLHLSKVPTPTTTDEALTYAIRANRGKSFRKGSTGPWKWRDEPQWWDPSALIRSLDCIGASNLQTVTAALNANPDVFQHLHTFRNFYAHRNRDTRERLIPHLRTLQFPADVTATFALASPDPSSRDPRPQPLLLDWLDDVRRTIALLV